MSTRAFLIVTTLLAVLFAASYVVPAVGGPSLGRTARTAKKALRTARAGPKVVEKQQVDVPAPPLDFAEFKVTCPRGYAAVGIGLGLGALEPVFFASTGRGAIGSMFNPSTTSSFTGDMFVECVKTARYVGAAGVKRMSEREALQELRAAEADVRRARGGS